MAATLPQPNRKSKALDSCRRGLLALALVLGLGGCGMSDSYLRRTDHRFAAGDIVATDGTMVEREAFFNNLAGVDVVYVGETHTNPEHHRLQLEILTALKKRRPDLVVAMEMFDKTYQPVLDQWSRGQLAEADFLAKTHWYANWRFDYALYRDILEWVRTQQVPLIGLNLPFYLPARIAVGGLDNLSAADQALLPERIDTTDKAHRAVIEPILTAHGHLKGRDNIEYLYQAQCAWDDAMADGVARITPGRPLVVLIGNGHIAYKHGVPNRALARNGASFRTVCLTEAKGPVRPDMADYVWVTQ